MTPATHPPSHQNPTATLPNGKATRILNKLNGWYELSSCWPQRTLIAPISISSTTTTLRSYTVHPVSRGTMFRSHRFMPSRTFTKCWETIDFHGPSMSPTRKLSCMSSLTNPIAINLSMLRGHPLEPPGQRCWRFLQQTSTSNLRRRCRLLQSTHQRLRYPHNRASSMSWLVSPRLILFSLAKTAQSRVEATIRITESPTRNHTRSPDLSSNPQVATRLFVACFEVKRDCKIIA